MGTIEIIEMIEIIEIIAIITILQLYHKKLNVFENTEHKIQKVKFKI